MIRAVIFDMDGLLIDSEPLWERAELHVFQNVGVPITPELTKQTMGLRSDEVVRYWYERYPWANQTVEQVNDVLIQEVIQLINTDAQPRRGVEQIVKLFDELNLPMAVASSSPEVIIDAALRKLGIRKYLRVIQSAELEPFGKPHPGVYITTASKLGVLPTECLAFEDSPNGVLSAKAARLRCVAVPDEKLKGDPGFRIADLVIESLVSFTPDLLATLQS
jgi:HAD superfamily hydrolase (TIGR01509 family)